MKMKNNNKILLVILSVILLITVYYKFVFLKQQEKIKYLSSKKSELNLQLSKMTNRAIKTKKISENAKIINAKIREATKDLFPPIEQENIILILNEIIKKSNIHNTSLSISCVNIENINQSTSEQNKSSEDKYLLDKLIREYTSLKNNQDIKKQDDKKSDSNKKDENDSLGLKKVSVSMNYAGSYDDLRKLIGVIEDFPRRIIISNLNVISGNKGSVMGSLTLDLYIVPKMYDDEFTKWNYNNNYGKYNPFKSGYEYNKASNYNKNNKEKKYDFILSVKPISSDLPTIILGKSNDNTQDSYIYADNKDNEELEIYFIKFNGKYYYKYKSEKNSYPKDFNGNGVIFNTNENDINFCVYSCSRNSSSDTAGAILNIHNNTDKNINIDIKYDDSDIPRVIVRKIEGNILVNRN